MNGNNNSKEVFNEVSLITSTPKVYQKVEFALYEEIETIANLGNPYDYKYLKVIGTFTSPKGDCIQMPAFWYQDYNIGFNENYPSSPSSYHGVPSTDPSEIQGLEFVTPKGTPHYRIRILPEEAGNWEYSIKVYEEGVTQVQTLSGNFNVEESSESYPGVITVDASNQRTFMFENGKTFIPIGQNLAWFTSSTRKTRDYDVWMGEMQAHQMNFARLWLAPWSFALHWGSEFDNFDSRFASLARLDRVITLAEDYDIYCMLALINHGQFSSSVNADWDNNPWNVKNGGVLTSPVQFFSNQEAREIYKSQLLYIIARYSYSNHIMCWELWNELDWVDSYNLIQLNTKLWQKEMATFLKANDPYHHLVSTSYKAEDGNAYSLDEIDFVNPHSYSYTYKNYNISIPNTMEFLFNKYQKPVIHSEIGVNSQNGIGTYEIDPEGITLKQQLWAGMMGGGAGGAMNWWWDSYVHPYDLYYRFEGAGAFSKLLNLSGGDYQQLRFLDGVTINNSNLNILGYRFNDRIYGYLFDKNWTHYQTNVLTKTNVSLSIPFVNGNYTLSLYSADTGELLNSMNIEVSNQMATFMIPAIETDIAFIIE